MSDKNNKSIFLAVYLILCFLIFLVLLIGGQTVLSLIIALLFVWSVVAGIFRTKNSKKELYERLGISSDDELSLMLCEFEELVSDRLYLKDEQVVNINSYKCYYLYEIINLEKVHHYNRRSTLYRDTYELRIYTQTTNDLLYFGTNINGRDCAYLLLTQKMNESRKEYASDVCEEIVSHEPAYSEEEYDGYIMDEEDIKNKENRNDWLGSI